MSKQSAKLDHFDILLDFLCNFRITRFIHFSGLLNPGKSLPPAIGLAKDMNTEKKITISNMNIKMDDDLNRSKKEPKLFVSCLIFRLHTYYFCFLVLGFHSNRIYLFVLRKFEKKILQN